MVDCAGQKKEKATFVGHLVAGVGRREFVALAVDLAVEDLALLDQAALVARAGHVEAEALVALARRLHAVVQAALAVVRLAGRRRHRRRLAAVRAAPRRRLGAKEAPVQLRHAAQAGRAQAPRRRPAKRARSRGSADRSDWRVAEARVAGRQRAVAGVAQAGGGAAQRAAAADRRAQSTRGQVGGRLHASEHVVEQLGNNKARSVRWMTTGSRD